MQTIRLNRRDKTIKVVNRIDTVRLQHAGKPGPIGATGPQGDPAITLVTSVAGKQGVVTLDADDVGLSLVDNTPDVSKPVSTAAKAALDATYVQLAANPDGIIAGSLTRDSDGAVTSASVIWPDGSSGTFTATAVSTDFPGAVDAYQITYAGSPTRTYTQSLVTRNSDGAVTSRPAVVVT